MAVDIWKLLRFKIFDYAMSIDFVDELDGEKHTVYLTNGDVDELIEKLVKNKYGEVK